MIIFKIHPRLYFVHSATYCNDSAYFAVRYDILQCGDSVKFAPTFAAKDGKYKLSTTGGQLAPTSGQFFVVFAFFFCLIAKVGTKNELVDFPWFKTIVNLAKNVENKDALFFTTYFP